jgi:hypothetical protein
MCLRRHCERVIVFWNSNVCVLQAVMTVVEMLLSHPDAFEELGWYADKPTIARNLSGQVVSTLFTEPGTTNPM